MNMDSEIAKLALVVAILIGGLAIALFLLLK